MNTKEIQDAIMRELRKLRDSGKEVTRDQLYTLCVANEAPPVVVARFPRALYRLVDAGKVAQKLDGMHGVLRYGLPAERYRVRNAINAWHVDRQETSGEWRTVVQGTEREALLCATALNASETMLENSVAAATSRAVLAQSARRRAT